MSMLDIVLIVLIGVGFAFAMRRSVKDAKKGGCCGNCSACGRGCSDRK